MQSVAVDLMSGGVVFRQTSCMCWMSESIETNTATGGGVFAALARRFGSSFFFITEFSACGTGHVAFASRFPGTIMPGSPAAGRSLVCRKGTLLIAEKSVSLEIAWQKRCDGDRTAAALDRPRRRPIGRDGAAGGILGG
jgi:uncharacterized protein (AIM24 family)